VLEHLRKSLHRLDEEQAVKTLLDLVPGYRLPIPPLSDEVRRETIAA
jgi:hypothetical protein